ncbi:MAG: PEP-CTERM sorting domain-containing protein [Acidobacteriaceae bacterium]
MKNLIVRLALVGALAAAPFAANATPVKGSDSIALFNVTVAPANSSLKPISGVQTLSYTIGLISQMNGTGAFFGVPIFTPVSGATLYPSGVNGGNGVSPFDFTIAGFGTFTETKNPIVVTNGKKKGSSSVDFYLLGTFTPSGALAGFQPNSASFNVSFTENGNATNGFSYSGSGTLSAPGNGIPNGGPVPEPSSIALLGTAVLVGAGFMKKRLLA